MTSLLSQLPCPATSQVPWEDLRYLIGEIMYGGHIGQCMPSYTAVCLHAWPAIQLANGACAVARMQLA